MKPLRPFGRRRFSGAMRIAAALLGAAAAASAGHGPAGRSFAVSNGESPAAQGMALTLLGLVLFVICGVAAFALSLRRRALYPSPAHALLEDLAGDQAPPEGSAPAVSREEAGPEPWNRSADWWRQPGDA